MQVSRRVMALAGELLFAAGCAFSGVRTHVDHVRLRAFFAAADIAAAAAALAERAAIVAGAVGAGTVATLPPSDRFSLVVAPASTVVRPGPVHTGLCDDADATLGQPFACLVLMP